MNECIEQNALDGVMERAFVKTNVSYLYQSQSRKKHENILSQVPLEDRQRNSIILRKERL